jgi:hypothetical protein
LGALCGGCGRGGGAATVAAGGGELLGVLAVAAVWIRSSVPANTALAHSQSHFANSDASRIQNEPGNGRVDVLDKGAAAAEVDVKVGQGAERCELGAHRISLELLRDACDVERSLRDKGELFGGRDRG